MVVLKGGLVVWASVVDEMVVEEGCFGVEMVEE